MKSALIFFGPIILTLGFLLWSDGLTFGNQHPGMIHVGGVGPGGTFNLFHKEVYRCDENGVNCVLVDEETSFSEMSGLELEQETIEYRDGMSKDYNKTKQPGLTKYANISVKRPMSFDWKGLKFEFERLVEIDEVNREYDAKIKETQTDE